MTRFSLPFRPALPPIPVDSLHVDPGNIRARAHSISPESTGAQTIHVHVRLRSILRHRDGEVVNQRTLELPQGSRAGDALVAANIPAHFEVVLVVNDVLVDADAVLPDGGRLMVLPMLAGG